MESPFKSKLLRAYDYRKIDISEFCTPFQKDEAELEESLMSVRKKFAYQETVHVVAEGDLVTLTCTSEKPKFQKENITVCVGKKLYSAELESQIVGLSIGDTKALQVEGVPVNVHIVEAKRNTLPTLTDDFVASHFETVHTVEELKAWYAASQRENHLRTQAEQAVGFIVSETIGKSDFSVDEAERKQARESGESIVRSQWEFNGTPLDTMTDEQAQEILGHPTVQSYIDWFSDLTEQDLYCAVLGWNLLSEEGNAPTPEAYEMQLKTLAEEENASIETMREQYTFYAFAHQTCAEYFNSIARDYAYHYLKERIK